jgi:hypothetical protein
MIDRMIKSGLMGPAAGESTRCDARSHQGTLFTGLQLTLELTNSGPPVVPIDGIEIEYARFAVEIRHKKGYRVL